MGQEPPRRVHPARAEEEIIESRSTGRRLTPQIVGLLVVAKAPFLPVRFSTMNMLMFGLGWGEIVLIIAVLLLFFGAKKLPELAKGLGQGIKEFKKASTDMQQEFQRSVEDTHTHQVQQVAPTPAPAAAAEQSKSGAGSQSDAKSA